MHFPDGLPAARIMITVSRKQWIRYIWSCVVNWWLLVGDRRGIWWLSPRLNYYIILSTPTSPIPARRFIRRNIKQIIPRSRCWRKLTTCLQLHDHPTTCLLLSLLRSIIRLRSLISKHDLCFHATHFHTQIINQGFTLLNCVSNAWNIYVLRLSTISTSPCCE